MEQFVNGTAPFSQALTQTLHSHIHSDLVAKLEAANNGLGDTVNAHGHILDSAFFRAGCQLLAGKVNHLQGQVWDIASHSALVSFIFLRLFSANPSVTDCANHLYGPLLELRAPKYHKKKHCADHVHTPEP